MHDSSFSRQHQIDHNTLKTKRNHAKSNANDRQNLRDGTMITKSAIQTIQHNSTHSNAAGRGAPQQQNWTSKIKFISKHYHLPFGGIHHPRYSQRLNQYPQKVIQSAGSNGQKIVSAWMPRQQPDHTKKLELTTNQKNDTPKHSLTMLRIHENSQVLSLKYETATQLGRHTLKLRFQSPNRQHNSMYSPR